MIRWQRQEGSQGPDCCPTGVESNREKLGGAALDGSEGPTVRNRTVRSRIFAQISP
jgi:hypothetical protein